MSAYMLIAGASGYTDPWDKWTAPAGACVMTIVYDGVSPYTPPAGLLAPGSYDGRSIFTPTPTALPPASLAANLASKGVSITSTGSPAVSGIYGLDQATMQAVQWTTAYGPLGQAKFPGATALFHLLDINGVPHTFPNVTVLQAFVEAYSAIAAELAIYATGQGGAPGMSATIP